MAGSRGRWCVKARSLNWVDGDLHIGNGCTSATQRGLPYHLHPDFKTILRHAAVCRQGHTGREGTVQHDHRGPRARQETRRGRHGDNVSHHHRFHPRPCALLQSSIKDPSHLICRHERRCLDLHVVRGAAPSHWWKARHCGCPYYPAAGIKSEWKQPLVQGKVFPQRGCLARREEHVDDEALGVGLSGGRIAEGDDVADSGGRRRETHQPERADHPWAGKEHCVGHCRLHVEPGFLHSLPIAGGGVSKLAPEANLDNLRSVCDVGQYYRLSTINYRRNDDRPGAPRGP